MHYRDAHFLHADHIPGLEIGKNPDIHAGLMHALYHGRLTPVTVVREVKNTQGTVNHDLSVPAIANTVYSIGLVIRHQQGTVGHLQNIVRATPWIFPLQPTFGENF